MPFKMFFFYPFAQQNLNKVVFLILYHVINIKITQLSNVSNVILLISLGPVGRAVLPPPIQCYEEEKEVDCVQRAAYDAQVLQNIEEDVSKVEVV